VDNREVLVQTASIRNVLVASLAWSLAAVAGAPGAVLAVTVGLILLMRATRRVGAPIRSPDRVVFVGVVAVVAIALTTQLIRIPNVTGLEVGLWLVLPAALASFGLASAVRQESIAPAAALTLIAAVIAAAAWVMVDHAGTNVGVDVYLSHVAAADALADGENPYTDAVRYPNGSPFADEGSVLEGYGYPPVTLWAYAVSTWLTGDPRWLNVAAWVTVIGSVLWRLYRHRPDLVVPFALVLAVAPAWRLIVFTGWTEPLTIGLLVAAAFAWRRTAIGSGILLGLALASKQYMILLVPLLLLHRDRDQVRRVATAGVTALASLVPYAVADFGLFVDRLVTRPLSFGYRPDTQSLPGLLDRLGATPDIPVVVAVAAVVVVSWAVTRAPRGPDTFLIGTAVVMGVFFLLSLGFANYWFFVSGVLVAGAAFVPVREASPVEGRSAVTGGDEDGR
jgi:hypothetical protein